VSHIVTVTIVAPSATPTITNSLVSSGEIEAPTAIIGDVYYSANIVSPIPVISTTSYGTTSTVPPLVVNGPLSVLSTETDATSLLFTMSGSQTSGFESGGTNNSGVIWAGGTVELRFPYGAGSGGKALLETIRLGDIITAIGANGIFTGSKTFTVTRVSSVEANGDVTGYVEIHGLVDTAPGSDTFFNANIITCYRPNTTSTFVGGISSNFLSADQVVATDISATGALSINKTFFAGAIEKRSPGFSQPSMNVNTNLVLNYRTTDYLSMTAYANTSGYGFTGVYLNLDAHGEISERELTLMIQVTNNDVTWNLAQAVWNTITYHGEDQSMSTGGTTVKWKGGVSSGTLTSGRFYCFTFRVRMLQTGPSEILASVDEYY
jgi:hypothetical protein